MENIRIDKYLWSIRIYKTRNLAAEECKKGHVFINGEAVKQSKIVKIGDNIEIKFQNIMRSFSILMIIDKRVSAVLAKDAILETTDPIEFEKLKQIRQNTVKLSERPTKKNRRLLEKFYETQEQ